MIQLAFPSPRNIKVYAGFLFEKVKVGFSVPGNMLCLVASTSRKSKAICSTDQETSYETKVSSLFLWEFVSRNTKFLILTDVNITLW